MAVRRGTAPGESDHRSKPERHVKLPEVLAFDAVTQERLDRLLVFLGVGADLASDAGFSKRLRRVRDILERFALPFAPPPSTPPGSAPAHAVVFAPSARHRK